MISRRDFVNGVAMTVGGAALGACSRRSRSAALAGEGPVGMAGSGGPPIPGVTAAEYPPLRQGIRGQHDGSFDVAHQLAWGGREDWGPTTELGGEVDLVVVGAGLSGLSAAHFYRKRMPQARILLLDNHDDFGGHARRNEFEVDGRMFLGTGGSQSIVNVALNKPMRTLFADLAIELDAFEEAYDDGFYTRHGLEQVWFFDKQTYGVDQTVRMAGPLGFNVPLPTHPVDESIAAMPLSDAAKRELLALCTMNEDTTPKGLVGELDYLKRITYEQLLTEHCGVTQRDLVELLSAGVLHAGYSADNSPADFAIMSGMPGIGGTSLRMLREHRMDKLARWMVNYIHHFPDGNAGVARLLVRHLIPAVSDGGTSMSSVVTAPFDYAKLDVLGAPVRLRLNSTVVKVEHEGSPAAAKRVAVTYVRGGQAARVHARHVILACQNRVIPHIWKELPAPQAQALGQCLRSPIFYTNVVLRRWHALRDAGIAGAFSPGCLHSTMIADLPISLGDYRYSQGPDEPIVLYMGGSTIGSGEATPGARFKTQRYQLLSMPFEAFEADLRRQLGGMLGPHGFDADRDIAGITVNRWSHGFTMAPNLAFGEEYGKGEAPHERGRAPLGRVAMANCDSAAMGLQQGAYEQAWRAVDEVLG